MHLILNLTATDFITGPSPKEERLKLKEMKVESNSYSSSPFLLVDAITLILFRAGCQGVSIKIMGKCSYRNSRTNKFANSKENISPLAEFAERDNETNANSPTSLN